MAFVINKKSKRWGETRRLYYLAESYREDNKVKRRTLLALGEHKTLHDFLASIERKEASVRYRLNSYEEKLNGEQNEVLKYRLAKSMQVLLSIMKDCQNNKEKVKSFM